MRILYLHQYFATPSEAGGTRSYEMARRLVAAGHTVTIVTSSTSRCGRAQRRIKIEGIDVIYLPVGYDNSMGSARRVLSFVVFSLRACWCVLILPCDLVFATSTPLTITIPGLVGSARHRVPYVFEVRDMWPDVPIAMGALRSPLLRRLSQWLERLTYRRADHIVALAPGMKNEIVAKLVPADKITVIPNGCDNDLFGAVEPDEASNLLEQLPEVARSGPFVLFAGTLGRANGVEYLAEIAREVAIRDPSITFIVCGDGKERRRLERRASIDGTLGQTFFMLGPRPKLEVASWMRLASVSVCLFKGPEVLYRNAVQNKFFDSLAGGVPVACNFIGWQSQIALDEGAGVYLPPDDAAQGARVLIDAVRNVSWHQRASASCRELALERFDRDVLARHLDAVLRSVV